MTEDEAKTKICCGPLYLADALTGLYAISAGKDHPKLANGNCGGSACMAWRWMAWVEGVAVSYSPGYGDKTNGYCGLAGKP